MVSLKFKKEDAVEEKNTISSPSVNLNDTMDNFKKQKELAKQLTLRMSDLVAAKDLKNNKVEFNDKNTGKAVFEDVGSHIVMSDKKPNIEHVALAMTFAAEKFGKVQINGTKEFKQQVIDVAVAKDLNVVFADKKMQEQFNKAREDSKVHQVDNTIKNANPLKQDLNDNNAKVSVIDKAPVTLVSHGAAPYENVKDNAQSYYVKTSDGKVQWGVGLKEAVEKSNVKIGDEITINKLDSTKVIVNVETKDKLGKVIGSEPKEVLRNEWEIKQVQRAKDIAQDVKPIIDKVVELKTNAEDKIVKAAIKVEDKIVSAVTGVKKEKDDINKYQVTYNWSQKDKKMEVLVNGKSPKEIPENILEKIQKNDKFLNSFSTTEIRGGGLDLGSAKVPPVPRVFNQHGEPLKAVENTKTNTQTQ